MPEQPSATIVHVVHSLEGGGMERSLVSLVNALDSSQMRHVVITMREAGGQAGKLGGHVACRALGIQGNSRTAGWTLGRIARGLGASLLHARGMGCWGDAMVAALSLPTVPLVLGFHGLENGPSFNRRQRRLAWWGGRLGASFTSVSQAGVAQLAGVARVPLQRIAHLPNGVRLEKFRPLSPEERAKLRVQLGLPVNGFVVGTVASLTPIKRHDLLIEALKLLRAAGQDLWAMIVGEGPLRRQLLQQAERAGVVNRVRFLGEREDVRELLACMDAYVCSSDSEGMSNAILEAMAAEVPILASHVGDNGLLVGDGGIVFPSCSTVSLSQAIGKVLHDCALRTTLGQRARQRVSAFRFEQSVRRFEEFYLWRLKGRLVNGKVIRRTDLARFEANLGQRKVAAGGN